MSDYPHLDRAPITEAVFDVQVELPPGTLISDLESSFGQAVRAEYPDPRPLRQVSFSLEGEEPVVTSSPTLQLGTIYWRSDKLRAVQARINGFSVNHVKRYERWSSLRDNALKLWPTYCATARPLRVVRVALRYINRLELPAAGGLDEYFFTKLTLGAGLPQAPRKAFFRAELPFDDARTAVLTCAIETPAAESADASVIIDIDVSRLVDMTPAGPEIWAEFERLRELKNRCFYESLTEKAWGRYR